MPFPRISLTVALSKDFPDGAQSMTFFKVLQLTTNITMENKKFLNMVPISSWLWTHPWYVKVFPDKLLLKIILSILRMFSLNEVPYLYHFFIINTLSKSYYIYSATISFILLRTTMQHINITCAHKLSQITSENFYLFKYCFFIYVVSLISKWFRV